MTHGTRARRTTDPGRRRTERGRGGARRAAAVAALLAAAPAAWAAEDAATDPAADAARELQLQLQRAGPGPGEQRPFAFVVDASLPPPGGFSLGYTVGVGSGVSADRPIPVVLQGAGVSHQLSLGYGLTSWLEPLLDLTATASNGSTVASGTLGVKVRLTAPSSPWRAAVLAGALREGASGATGAWARGVASFGVGPLLAEVNGYLERVSAPGRDRTDYAVTGGASWRFLDGVRGGLEYVGQDLEELVAAGAEGGARQAVGPSVKVDLDRGRYQLVAATLFGVGALPPAALVRVGLLGTF